MTRPVPEAPDARPDLHPDRLTRVAAGREHRVGERRPRPKAPGAEFAVRQHHQPERRRPDRSRRTSRTRRSVRTSLGCSARPSSAAPCRRGVRDRVPSRTGRTARRPARRRRGRRTRRSSPHGRSRRRRASGGKARTRARRGRRSARATLARAALPGACRPSRAVPRTQLAQDILERARRPAPRPARRAHRTRGSSRSGACRAPRVIASPSNGRPDAWASRWRTVEPGGPAGSSRSSRPRSAAISTASAVDELRHRRPAEAMPRVAAAGQHPVRAEDTRGRVVGAPGVDRGQDALEVGHRRSVAGRARTGTSGVDAAGPSGGWRLLRLGSCCDDALRLRAADARRRPTPRRPADPADGVRRDRDGVPGRLGRATTATPRSPPRSRPWPPRTRTSSSRFSIGKSYQGREHVGGQGLGQRRRRRERSPRSCSTARTHADEHMGVEMTLRILHWLVDGYGTRPADHEHRRHAARSGSSSSSTPTAPSTTSRAASSTSGARTASRRRARHRSAPTSIATSAIAGAAADGRARTRRRSRTAGRRPSRRPRRGPCATSWPAASSTAGSRSAPPSRSTRTAAWSCGRTATRMTNVPADMTTAGPRRARRSSASRWPRPTATSPSRRATCTSARGRRATTSTASYRIFAYTFEMSIEDYPDDSMIAAETGRNKEAVLYLMERAWCPLGVLGAAVRTARCGAFDDDLEVCRGWNVNPDGTDTAPAGAAFARRQPAPRRRARPEAARDRRRPGRRALVTGRPAGADAERQRPRRADHASDRRAIDLRPPPASG